MFKWIARDYFAAFRWEKVKENFKGESLFIFILVVWLLFPIKDFTGKIGDLTMYILIFFSFLFTEWSGTLHSMRLPKALFLCPIERSVRKEYIVKSCCFRIGLTIAVNVFCILILLCLGLCDWKCGVLLVLNGAFFSVLRCGVKKKSTYTEPSPSTEITRENIGELLNIFVTIMSAGIIAFILLTGVDIEWKTVCIILGVAVFVQLPLTLLYMRKVKESIEQAVDYESSYL